MTFKVLFFLGLAALTLTAILLLQKQSEIAAASAAWPTVSAQIIDSRLEQRFSQQKEGSHDEWKAVIRYRYQINGQTFESQQRRFPETGFSQNQAGEAAIAARYPTGSTVTAYVNPSQPQQACLEAGRHWSVWVGQAMTLAICVFSLWMAWRSATGKE